MYQRLITILLVLVYGSSPAQSNILLKDDFEHGLDKWDLYNPAKIVLLTTADKEHKNVVRLIPGGSNIYMLIKGTEKLKDLSMEGDVLFPDTLDSYFGVLYNYTIAGDRNDYGCIYIKGNGNYVWANPHRNHNVSRELYNDFKIPLGSRDSIIIGGWKHFKVEVIDSVCDFYVGDMNVPKMRFPFFEYASGRFGFEPRVNGSEVWLDNVIVKSIKSLSYKGTPVPDIHYTPDNRLIKWESAGPFVSPQKEIENEFLSQSSGAANWSSFVADGRGCILTGKITGWANLKRIVYFKYTFDSNEERDATLSISSTNPVWIWCNGTQKDFTAEQSAWYDVGLNPKHTHQSVPLHLTKGVNVMYVRTLGQSPFDGYSGDGFFYRIQ